MENELMRTTKIQVAAFRLRLASVVAIALLSLLVVGYGRPGFAQISQAKTFSSPVEACHALFQAVQNGDEQGLEAILGAGKEVTSSSDEVEDKLERERFSQKYQEMHRLVREPGGSTILYIGAENWPFPIPIVSVNGLWHFDSDSGKKEILFRTIGENEATAIQVCDAFAAAKKQGGTTETGDDPVAGYAQKLVSVSSASPGTNADTTLETELFQGYYFRTGKKTARVALVAYPAKYRSSGVMTFLVTRDGVVYEKDLGPDTTTAAPKISGRNIDSSWHRAE
jgi:hypothetical protein